MFTIRGILTALVASVALSTAGADSLPATLVQPADLRYAGSFNLPAGIKAGGQANLGFESGGGALAFDAARQGLYLVGHDWDQFTAEIAIPRVGETAELLQGFTDATDGKLGAIGAGSARIGGQMLFNGRLHFSAFLFYDGTGQQTISHFVRPPALDVTGQTTGPVRVGEEGAGFYSGYMTEIPAAWRVALGGPALTGNCCLSVISRTSYGPAAFAFDPEKPGTAVPLVYYTQSNQTLGKYGAEGVHPTFNGTTRITGVVFPERTASVLFFGTTGTGSYCYGEAAECGDSTNGSKGEHAAPYRGYVWAYDARDLAAVKSGRVRPWAVKPYQTWELTALGDVNMGSIGGAAYDRATGRVFVSQKNGRAALPVIHVFHLAE